MTAEERIIDAMLEEAVGQVTPPDMTNAVLRSIADKQDASLGDETSAQNREESYQVSIAQQDLRVNVVLQRRQKQWSIFRPGLAVAASFCLASVVVATSMYFRKPGEDVAKNSVSVHDGTFATEHRQHHVIDRVDVNRSVLPLSEEPRILFAPEEKSIEPDQTREYERLESGLPQEVDIQPERLSDAQIVKLVDRSINERIRLNNISPADTVTDDIWCERTHQRLVGRLPDDEELQHFQTQEQNTRKADLIETLIDSDEFASYWARDWSRQMLAANASEVLGNGFRDYLYTAIRQDKPFDELTVELITASGRRDQLYVNKNQAVAFVLSYASERSKFALTHATARVFLGSEWKCAECHDHPFESVSALQLRYVNAFFQNTKLSPNQVRETNNLPKDSFFNDIDGQLKLVVPRFLDNSSPDSLDDLRKQYSGMVVRHPNFSRTITNRIWRQLMDFGFSRLGIDQTPSHPDVLDQLARSFVNRKYDVKSLVRWIVSTDAFARSADSPTGNDIDLPGQGTDPLFSYRYHRLKFSLTEALRLVRNEHLRNSNNTDLSRIVKDFGKGKQKGSDKDKEEIVQSFEQEQLRSLFRRRKLSPVETNYLARLAQSVLSDDDKIEHLWMAARTAHPPTKKEQQLVSKLLKGYHKTLNSPMSQQLLEEIWWAARLQGL